jgi:hypothetical protein
MHYIMFSFPKFTKIEVFKRFSGSNADILQLMVLHFNNWGRGSVVGWDIMLQAGRSRVRVPFEPHYDHEVDSASNKN